MVEFVPALKKWHKHCIQIIRTNIPYTQVFNAAKFRDISSIMLQKYVLSAKQIYANL